MLNVEIRVNGNKINYRPRSLIIECNTSGTSCEFMTDDLVMKGESVSVWLYTANRHTGCLSFRGKALDVINGVVFCSPINTLEVKEKENTDIVNLSSPPIASCDRFKKDFV